MALNSDFKCLLLNKKINQNQHVFWTYVSKKIHIFKYALSYNKPKLLKVLLPYVVPSNEDFTSACKNRYPDIVKVLLKDGRVDPTYDNNYAIKYSVEIGHTNLTKLLYKDKRVRSASDTNYRIQNMKHFLNSNESFASFCCIAAIYCISLPIFLGVFFGVVYKDINTIDDTLSATCTTVNYTNTPFHCCERVNCICQECSIYPNCNSAQTSLMEGPCCRSSRSCSRVESQTCQIICGMCFSLTAILNVTVDEDTFLHIIEGDCNRDDSDCIDEFVDEWNFQDDRCYYNDENGDVSFSEPEYNYAALVFVGIFGLCLVVPSSIYCIALISYSCLYI